MKTFVADGRHVLVHAVVVAGDRAGADVGASRRSRRRRGSSGGRPWCRCRSSLFLTSTKLPRWHVRAELGAAADAGERPDRWRRSPIVAPSMWQKARILTPSPIFTPGPKTDVRLRWSRRGRSRCRRRNRRVAGSCSVTPAFMKSSRRSSWNCASARASCARSLTPITSRSGATA